MKYRLIEDPQYHYLRADPLPTENDVEKYYKEDFYSRQYPQFNDSSLEIQLKEKLFFESRWMNVTDRCKDYFGDTNGKKLFDIGFGYGLALLYFREKGFSVSGIEPTREGYEYALSNGLSVIQGRIESLYEIGEERYDVVTMFNVLEHLRKPAEALKQIRDRLLRPEGLLVIDVPNDFNDFQTVANKEYHLKEWWFCPPNHINYFSVTSLKSLLQDCGYNVKYCESSFPIELFLLFGDVYVGDNDLGRICHEKRVQFEYLMRKHGKQEKIRKLYEAFADLDIGRQAIIFSTPNLV